MIVNGVETGPLFTCRGYIAGYTWASTLRSRAYQLDTMSVDYSPRRSPTGCNRNSWLHVVKCSHQRHEKDQLRANGNISGPRMFGSRIRRSLAGKVPGLDPEFRPSPGARLPLPLPPPTPVPESRGICPRATGLGCGSALAFRGSWGDGGRGQAVQNALRGRLFDPIAL